VSERPRTEPRPAGFWIRAVALVIDAGVITLVQVSLGFAAGRLWGPGIAASPVFASAVVAFTLLFAVLYPTVLHAATGQTIGKMLLGIRVVGAGGEPLSAGAALLRTLAYFASLLPLGMGFVMAGLRHDRRALHDLLAGSRVEHAPAPVRGRPAPPVSEPVAPTPV